MARMRSLNRRWSLRLLGALALFLWLPIQAAGGNLTLNGPVEQDVVITGGMVDIGSGATIGRDLAIAGGTATVSAPVARRIRMASGNVTLRSRVGGDVIGNVDHLRLDGA